MGYQIVKNLLLLALGAVVLAAPTDDHSPGRGKGSGSNRGKYFQQFGMIMMENTNYSVAAAQPFYQQFQKMDNNRVLTNYYSIIHPSTPNYIAVVAGTTYGSENWGASPVDNNTNGRSVIDLFEEHGISWKWYVEDYPGDCNLEANNGPAPPNSTYGAIHVAPLWFTSVQNNPERCNKIVEAGQFMKDFNNGNLPQFWTYIPSLNHDGDNNHDIATQNAYLTKTFLPLLKNKTFLKDLLFLIAYDEYGSKLPQGPSRVWAGLAGSSLGPATSDHTDGTFYTHYSVPRTIEDNWNLGSLHTNDSTSSPFNTS